MNTRVVSELDLKRLAKAIQALLDDAPAERMAEAVAAIQSMDDLGKDLNRAARNLQERLARRLKVKEAGHS